MYHVVITGSAKRDIQAAHDWWAENRSADQAVRWYVGIHKAIYSLKQMPIRCSLAPESDLLEQGIRQVLFGLGRQPTHRIVFVVDSEDVVVLRVRYCAQDALAFEDLR
jgi:plasmid stabilization system protein ParE